MTLSYKVFMSFVDDGDGRRVLSTECYNTWVMTRKGKLKQPEESFRRVLTAHVCGMDGRRPFPKQVEQSILVCLRKREVWDCFRGTGVAIGIRGFRNYGYHELQEMKKTPKAKGAKESKSTKEGSSSSKPRAATSRNRKRKSASEATTLRMNKTNIVAKPATYHKAQLDIEKLYIQAQRQKLAQEAAFLSAASGLPPQYQSQPYYLPQLTNQQPQYYGMPLAMQQQQVLPGAGETSSVKLPLTPERHAPMQLTPAQMLNHTVGQVTYTVPYNPYAVAGSVTSSPQSQTHQQSDYRNRLHYPQPPSAR